ncbi:hypothetical protein N2152v2_011230 [Parachlorella kessleri]
MAAQARSPEVNGSNVHLTRRSFLDLVSLALTGAICSVAYFGGDSLLAEVSTWEVLDLPGDSSLGAGDAFGALLWSVGLYFASPWQLLLLFIGQMDNERPSDALLRFFGKLGGLSVDAKDYRAPAWAQAATVAVCALCGSAIAAALGSWLGDPSWSISTGAMRFVDQAKRGIHICDALGEGLGACMAAGMYEVGRPQRLSVEEAQLLEEQYQDFVAFADEQLQRTGRCHESEVIRGFRRTKGRYRRASGPESVISDTTIRDMIRSWHRRADRTGSGYYKNLSFRPIAADGTSAGQPTATSTGTAGPAGTRLDG